ncbi:hypothetical protein H2O73_14710 [Vibrio sp. 404]|uniref:Pilus assembly protein PilW n=1 Tax=Vibrio marinisediminis TaxID=2758441 RepID=A0A7W2IV15_9VIBR|nr:hypothetical protein [Vibrio marinisediminis]MBA5763612.1 hypothetical protein [Vibrio marinisediminis]
MATHPAVSSVKGFTVIEFIVSAAIGGVALGIIGSIFISAQNVAHQKSQQLNLLQSLTSTFQTIEEDIQRAGFDSAQGQSLTLSGATSVITQNGGSEFGMAYYRQMVDNKNYRSLRYYLNDGKLILCEQGVLVKSEIKALTDIASCRSLLDQNIVQVTSFALSSTPLINTNATSAIWHLSISAHTVDNAYQRQLAVDIKQRNWQ